MFINSMRLHSDRVSILLMMVLAAGVTAGIAVKAGTAWDFANFYDAGHKIAAGQIGDLYNPDALISGKAPEARLPYWGTPLSAYLLAPLAWLSAGPAFFVFKAENTAALLLGLWLLYRYNSRLTESKAD